MLKYVYVMCFATLVVPIHAAAEEQVVTPRHSVPIRVSPPSPWLLGLPGWQVARAKSSERYALLQTLNIHAFSSTQTWAEFELENSDYGLKKGWVYWGESLDDERNFEIYGDTKEPKSSKNSPLSRVTEPLDTQP